MKRYPEVFKHNKLYANILILLVVVIAFNTLIVSSILYVNFKNTNLNFIYSSSKESLSQISYSATIMASSAKTAVLQLYFDPDIKQIINYSSLEQFQVDKGLRKLSFFRDTTPNIHSIYLYNRITRLFYDTLHVYSLQESPDPEMLNLIEQYQDYKSFSPIPRTILVNGREEEVYTFLYYDPPAVGKKLDNAIVLNVSVSGMSEIISAIDKSSEKNIFIIDNAGTVILGNENYEILTNISREQFIQKLIHGTEASGYSTEIINGEKTFVTYVSSDLLGWKFVRLTPFSEIVSEINKMKNWTILTGMIILLVGLIVSFLLSGKLYNPVRKLLSKLDILEEEKRNHSYAMKQEFLSNLLLNKDIHNLSMIKEELERYEIKFNVEKLFILVLLKIDYFQEFCQIKAYTDRKLLKFAIMNITQEIVSGSFPNETIDIGNDHVVLILNVIETKTADQAKVIQRIIENIQSSVEKHLKISISAAVTSENTVHSLSQLYDEAVETSLYRLSYGRKSIIFSDEVQRYKTKEYTYPLETEKQLIESLMLGKETEVDRLFSEIMDEARNYSYSALSITILKLAFSIKISLDTLENNHSILISRGLGGFIQSVSSLETVEDVDKKFAELFERIYEQVAVKSNKKKNLKYDDLINKIIEIINNEYQNPNLSLDAIADSVHMSPAYLGRIFNKTTSKSVQEYINYVRLNIAKELLSNSTYTINEIATMSGFSNINYFFTVFKKSNGLTPNEFRKLAGNK